MEILITPKDAALALSISIKTLEAMRIKGLGPKYVKVSSRKVAYRADHLKEWIDNRTFSSTSQYI